MGFFSRSIRLIQNGAALEHIARAAKNHPKRLLLIAHELTASGSSLLLANLCQTYADMGYAIVIMTENEGPIATPIQAAVDRSCGLLRLSGRKRIRFCFLQRLQKMGFHLAIGNTVLSGRLALDLRKAGIRSIFLIHEMTASLSILRMQQTARDLLGSGETLVFPAERVRDVFLRYAGTSYRPEKLRLLPQGCRLSHSDVSQAQAAKRVRERLKIPDNAAILVGSGAINFGKGVDLCLLVLQKLRKLETDRPYHLVWLGTVQEEDPFFQWLLVQIDACGLGGRMHFVGFIGDASTYCEMLSGSDVFFLSSREDSFPSVMIEAMCLQLPVLAFEGSGGGAEYIERHGMGVCVPMADVDAACSAAISICGNRGNYANADTERRARGDFEFGAYAQKLLTLLKQSTEKENEEPDGTV